MPNACLSLGNSVLCTSRLILLLSPSVAPCSVNQNLLLVVYPMHWIDPLVSFCPSEQIGGRTITSTILYRFFTKFCTQLRNVVSLTHIVCETNRK